MEIVYYHYLDVWSLILKTDFNNIYPLPGSTKLGKCHLLTETDTLKININILVILYENFFILFVKWSFLYPGNRLLLFVTYIAYEDGTKRLNIKCAYVQV